MSASMGWRPVFLLMRRVSDSGSSTVLGGHVAPFEVKNPGSRTYRELEASELAALS